MAFQGPKSPTRERPSSPQESHEVRYLHSMPPPQQTHETRNEFQHRIRHLMAVQVRNFTPFPVRDAVTSSLAVTGPPLSDCVDDMELTLGRRKSRRISTNSLGTLRNLRTSGELNRPDQTPPSPTADTSPGRPRANSRSIRKVIPASYQHRPTRERAASSASIQSLAKLALNKPRTSLSAEDASPPSSPILALPEAAELQSDLEHVVASRLVETFLTLESWTQEDDNNNAPVSPLLGSLNFPVRSDDGSARLRSETASSRITPSRRASFRPPTPSKVKSDDKQSRAASPGGLKKSTTKPRASPRTKRTELPQSTNNNHALPTPAPSPPPGDVPTLPPFYISAFHRPSTNPCFASLDSKHDFAAWADLGNHRFRASLWGTGGGSWGKTADGKERSPLIGGSEEPSPQTDWDILASWNVDMDELVPLPAEVRSLRLSKDIF
jgi:UV radiation resistance-associated gene protein